ncbi:MAG: Fic family protein [Kiritimatiellae bacterium]|jgi:Fic family protein|nr:Fic family protein [Kiritimatiellia bacterium]
MEFKPDVPYDNLPILPPSMDVESKVVLKQCLAATRALAELKGVGSLIPDQSILINSIPLQEAQFSSEIENIVTTQDELFRAALDESGISDPATKEVFRYRTALKAGCDIIQKQSLSVDLILNICRILRGVPELDFRSKNEKVVIGNAFSRNVIYTPPSGGQKLQTKLRNLEKFMQTKNGIDPLVKMAITHYQFEAIHPFLDGNGRTGRILNILQLVHSGLLDIPVLYLSRFIIKNKSAYYRLLRGVTEYGDWEPWLLYMLEGVEKTALWTCNRIRAIEDLQRETIEKCRNDIPKVYSRELIDLIFRQPYCKINFVVEAGLAKRQAASSYLQKLEQIGVLEGEKVGRDKVYKNPALLEILSE